MKRVTAQHDTPAALGYRMPAEWEKHEATWLGWPHNPTDWQDKLDTIRWVYGEIVRKIGAGETVRMLVNNKAEEQRARRYLNRAGADLRTIEFIVHPTNRGWMRDSGQSSSGGRRTINRDGHRPFSFQRLGEVRRLAEDRRVPETAARLLGKRLFHAEYGGKPFVIEGGGIDVNGWGTLLTTEECYLDPKVQVRNPGLGRKEIDETLQRYLGVTNVFWLVGGPVGDDTHGHIDDISGL